MRGRRPHARTDYQKHRPAPPVVVSLAFAVAPLALAYAAGHPVQAAAAVTVFAVLVVTRGRLEA